MGAAPAAEVIAIDPDQAFIHTHYLIYSCVRDFELGRGGRNTIASSAEGELLPAGEYFPRIRNWAK
jgi:hypothetical protein